MGNPFDALIVGFDAGKLQYVEKVTAGLMPHIWCAMMPLRQELTTDKYPFDDLPEEAANALFAAEQLAKVLGTVTQTDPTGKTAGRGGQ